MFTVDVKQQDKNTTNKYIDFSNIGYVAHAVYTFENVYLFMEMFVNLRE